MSGAIESNIGSEALFAALQRGDSELPDKMNETGMNCVFLVIKNVQEEAPHITYNLWSSITWESNGLFSWIVYPDEGIAPYALKQTQQSGNFLNTDDVLVFPSKL